MGLRGTLFAVVIGMTVTASAEDTGDKPASPRVDPAVIQQAGQLQAAAKLLRAAGKRELAEELMHEAGELIRPAMSVLDEKKAELSKLKKEVAELEQLLECPAEIRTHVRIYKLPINLWQSIQPDALSDLPGQVCNVDANWLDQFAELRNNQESITVQLDTILTTYAGVAAKLHQGSEVPIPVPNPNGTLTIQWREFGEILQVTPTVRGLGAVELAISLEHSERVDELAVELNGVKIPGLRKHKIHVKTQAHLTETVLIQAFDLDDNVLIYLITPETAGNK